jgi:hypothetical protein
MADVKHYLISIMSPPLVMHGYLMTTDEKHIHLILNEMMDFADENLGRIMPVALQTELQDGKDIVRSILCEHGTDEIRKTLAEATDFHRTIWVMVESDADCKRLMELH